MFVPTHGLFLAAAALAAPQDPAPGSASDWLTTGLDCELFVAADVDGDGHADVVTLNGNGELCVSRSVLGFKAGPWEVAARDLAVRGERLAGGDFDPALPGDEVILVAGGTAELFGRFTGGLFAERRAAAPPAEPAAAASPDAAERVDPPPYEPAAAPFGAPFRGDLTADGTADLWQVFTASRPSAHRLVRVAVVPAPGAADRDDDGLGDQDEARLGTDPLDRDTDDDGLLDGWEVFGLPRGAALGARILPLGTEPAALTAEERAGRLDPLRQDVLLALSYFAGVDRAAMEPELERVRALYRAMKTANPDGSSGIQVHFRIDDEFLPAERKSTPWWDNGDACLAGIDRGLFHWLQISTDGGGQASQTGDRGGAGSNGPVIAHEFGHQLSLSHTGDSEPAWCPLYPSLMNYAFSYALGGDGGAIRFSDGRFGAVELDERHLAERLPYAIDELRYLAAPPFRFTLADDGGGGTLIDWNQNGSFDAEPVEADINYGGSTYGGVRQEHEASAAAPALAYAGGICHLLAAERTGDHVWIKSWQGGDSWTEKRIVPGSATEFDPVVAGGGARAHLLVRRLDGWRIAAFDAGAMDGMRLIPGLPEADLAAAQVGERILLVLRHADSTLEARWLTYGEPPVLGAAQPLEVRSKVAPGIAVEPATGRIALITSFDNSRGATHCMRLTWLEVEGDRLRQRETIWTRGEASGNQCATRPTAAFSSSGQLVVFHTALPDGNGQMNAYRTSRVANAALDEGWLTCLMYDVWTRTRVPPAFATGPQGSVYAYRWDAGGEHNNWIATAHLGLGIDDKPMRDFDDGAQVSLWGIRHSILWMRHAPTPTEPASGTR